MRGGSDERSLPVNPVNSAAGVTRRTAFAPVRIPDPNRLAYNRVNSAPYNTIRTELNAHSMMMTRFSSCDPSLNRYDARVLSVTSMPKDTIVPVGMTSGKRMKSGLILFGDGGVCCGSNGVEASNPDVSGSGSR